jgi:membrane protease YdiL (CAAX protease family)
VSDAAAQPFRDQLRGFGPAGLAAFALIAAGSAVFMPIAAVLILIWAWASRTPFADIGLGRPKSWIGGLAVGLVLGVGLKLLMKAVVVPLLHAPAVNAVFHDLAGNLPATLKFAAYVVLGAAVAEEIVFRGFLFERLGKLMGRGAAATAATVIIVTALFGAAHWQQGPFGMLNAAVTGLIVAIVYLICRRKLFVPMVMHAAFDLTAGAMIYYNAETQISHWVFP